MQNLLFTVGLVALSVGCAMERLSLGLIVPASLAVSLLIYGRLRGKPDLEEQIHP